MRDASMFILFFSRRGRRSRCGLQEDAVDAVDTDDAGDPVIVDDDAARRQQRVAQRLPPREQPGQQEHGRQPLRPPAAQLPHRLRLVIISVTTLSPIYSYAICALITN